MKTRSGGSSFLWARGTSEHRSGHQIPTKRIGMSDRKITGYVLILIVSMFLVGCGSSSTPTMPPVTAAARFALVSNLLDNSVSTYAIDSKTGQLTAKDTVSTGGMSSGVIAVAPSGQFA